MKSPTTTSFEPLIKALAQGQTSSSQEDLTFHSIDKWHAHSLPELVVFAESTSDVVEVMKFSRRHQVPVYTRGAGIGYVGGCVPLHGGIALNMSRMNKILDLAPEDGCAVVQPGVITGDLQDAAHKLGWYYPPDPASIRECSIGGNIATNAGGPHCLKYGVTHHYVLGLEAVLANGQVLRTGGRCHKNKTGFDLAHLITGSEGMLAIITEATLRLIPHPPTRAMLSCVFPHFSDAAHAVQRILNAGHLPSALEITDSFTLNAARAYLGDSILPAGNAHLIVEIDGRPAAVASELQELQVLVKDLGSTSIDTAETDADCEAIWQLRRDFSYSLRATGLTKLNEDIVVPRSKLVELINFTENLTAQTDIPIACFGHAGDGNIHVNLMVEDYAPHSPQRDTADQALDQLFQWILANQGAITGEHGVGLAKKPWINQALGDTGMFAHQQIKNALDPHNLLNPGKFLDH